jgi:hypothetical protein
MTDTRQRLTAWLYRQRWRDQVTHLVAVRSRARGNSPPLHQVARDEAGDLEHGLDELAETLEEDASGRGGLQRYEVTAWQGEPEADGSQALGEFPVRLDMESDLVAPGDDVSQKDLLAQLMRHNEVQQRALLLLVGQTQAPLRAVIERQGAEIKHLNKNRLEQLQITEELLSGKHRRQLEEKREEASAEIKADLAKRFGTLLSVMLGKAAGKAVGDDRVARVESFSAFVGSLAPEQLERLVGVLDDAQRIAFTESLDTELASQEAKAGGKVRPIRGGGAA